MKIITKMKLTNEQIKELEEMRRKNEYETIFICTKCKKELKGMINVGKHVSEFMHYSYKDKKHPNLTLAIV